MEKIRITKSQKIKQENLRKSLMFNDSDWRKEQVETYKKYTMINVIPLHDVCTVLPLNINDKKTSGGIIIPDYIADASGYAVGMVVSIASGFKLKGDVELALEDFVLYDANNYKFAINYKSTEFHMLDAYQMYALLPPSLLSELIVTDALAAFKPEMIDISDPYEMAKLGNDTMPTGMQQGEQQFQKADIDIDDNIMAEVKGEKRK
jgi:co-chaperonin GroES (HSP10)